MTWPCTQGVTLTMLDHLPLELVGEIMRVTAVGCRLTDRQTILNIALSCSLGYGSSVPALFSAIIIDSKNEDHFVQIFNEDSRFSSGPLHTAPSQRLCPHIQHVFVETACSRFPTIARRLINLRAIFCLMLDHDILPPDIYQDISPTLKQCYVLSVRYPNRLPSYVTHVSYYFRAWSLASFTDFENYAKQVIPDTVTHVCIEVKKAFEPSCAPVLHSLLVTLLNRTIGSPVVMRLYDEAIEDESQATLLKAIARLEPGELRRRVLLWRDARSILDNGGDISMSKADCIVGRTPWLEAKGVPQGNLDAALARG